MDEVANPFSISKIITPPNLLNFGLRSTFSSVSWGKRKGSPKNDEGSQIYFEVDDWRIVVKSSLIL